MPKMEDDYKNYAKMSTLLNLYRKIYEMPYTYGNQNSMQDLCFLMNQISLSCGDYCFGLYHSGPLSYALENQIYWFFNQETRREEIRDINYNMRANSGIENLRLLKNSIIKSSFTDEEVEQRKDIIYFMNAVAIANYLIEYEKRRDALDTLNTMRDKKDVNEIAVIEAKKLSRIM